MNSKLRQLNAIIAFNGTPKKVLARYCGVSRSLFSMYLNGDVNMPPTVEERLRERLHRDFEAVKDEQQQLACS